MADLLKNAGKWECTPLSSHLPKIDHSDINGGNDEDEFSDTHDNEASNIKDCFEASACTSIEDDELARDIKILCANDILDSAVARKVKVKPCVSPFEKLPSSSIPLFKRKVSEERVSEWPDPCIKVETNNQTIYI